MFRGIKNTIRRQKRALFLTTLYVRLLGKEYMVEQDLKECATRLTLAMDPQALEFPALIADRVWGDDKFIHLVRFHIESNLMEEAVKEIRSNQPWYLKYSKDNSSDIRRVIRSVARAIQTA